MNFKNISPEKIIDASWRIALAGAMIGALYYVYNNFDKANETDNSNRSSYEQPPNFEGK